MVRGDPEVNKDGHKMRIYGDSDHTDNSKTRRSGTGFLVYLKNVLI